MQFEISGDLLKSIDNFFKKGCQSLTISSNISIHLFQKFDWPVARPVEEDEILIIEIYTRNRLFSDKLIGSYRMVLQNVIKDGRLAISDSLLDVNNKPLPVSKNKVIWQIKQKRKEIAGEYLTCGKLYIRWRNLWINDCPSIHSTS